MAVNGNRFSDLLNDITILCVKNHDRRSTINIISTVIRSFWIVLMCSIIILSLFINFMWEKDDIPLHRTDR